MRHLRRYVFRLRQHRDACRFMQYLFYVVLAAVVVFMAVLTDPAPAAVSPRFVFAFVWSVAAFPCFLAVSRMFPGFPVFFGLLW